LARDFDDLFDQMQYLRVLDASGNLLQQHRMSDIVEVAGEVHVNDGGHPPQHATPDFRQGAMR
jgi:hypothetical protein